jgi:hypothetical protein
MYWAGNKPLNYRNNNGQSIPVFRYFLYLTVVYQEPLPYLSTLLKYPFYLNKQATDHACGNCNRKLVPVPF